jgi:hypothetical protein
METYFQMLPFTGTNSCHYHLAVNVQQRRRCAKRPVRLTGVREQAADIADVVLLNVYTIVAFNPPASKPA